MNLAAINKLDGHSIWPTADLIALGFDADLVASVADTFESDLSDFKTTIFVNDNPVNQLHGVKSLDLLWAIAGRLGVVDKVERKMGRGFQAEAIKQVLSECLSDVLVAEKSETMIKNRSEQVLVSDSLLVGVPSVVRHDEDDPAVYLHYMTQGWHWYVASYSDGVAFGMVDSPIACEWGTFSMQELADLDAIRDSGFRPKRASRIGCEGADL